MGHIREEGGTKSRTPPLSSERAACGFRPCLVHDEKFLGGVRGWTTLGRSVEGEEGRVGPAQTCLVSLSTLVILYIIH
jgi:hypothetical protein